MINVNQSDVTLVGGTVVVVDAPPTVVHRNIADAQREASLCECVVAGREEHVWVNPATVLIVAAHEEQHRGAGFG